MYDLGQSHIVGAMGPRATLGSQPLGFEDGSIVVPGPALAEPGYDPYSMQDYGVTAEEAKSWFGKNWKWLAIGAGGLVAVGLVVKFVL